MRRWLAAGAVVAATFGVASATSLGTFDDIALSATTVSHDPCTVSDVRLLDGTIDLLSSVLLPGSEIDTVRLVGLSGNCDDATPVVVIGGLDLLDVAGGEQVLFVEELDPLPAGASGTLDVSVPSPIALGDGLALVLYDLTAVGATFCPAGSSCT